MNIKVLIVDDSHFFRRCIGDIVTKAEGMEVIGDAKNGQEAVDKALLLQPDVIMMDIEMPIKNGIDATREIMAKKPIPILMFSSLTHEGAKSTLDALDAGAADFLPKKFEEIAGSGNIAAELITVAIRALASKNRLPRRSVLSSTVTSKVIGNQSIHRTSVTSSQSTLAARVDKDTEKNSLSNSNTLHTPSGKKYSLLAIASSTGGPVALQTVLKALPSNFPHPILLVQHMPGTFTGPFAQRLNSVCSIGVQEAKNGDVLKPGNAYLAPGGMQMLLERGNRLKITKGPDELNYKPCADVTFATISKYQNGNTLALVLTGMGADGCDGAKLLANTGATIWAQDEASSVVYGMPQAVKKAGLTEKVMAVDIIADSIIKEMCNG